MNEITKSTRLFEILAVIITGIAKFIFVDVLPYKFWFIITAISFWAVYMLINIRRTPELLAYWGFKSKIFGKLFFKLLPYAIGCVLLFIIYGFYFKTIIFNWHILVIMAIYPLWGTIQQFLIVGLIAGNLNDFDKKRKIPKILIVLITSIIFSVVHLPSVLLVIGTFVLAIAYTLIYIKEKNVYVLGIYHGWLGALFYFFVLGRDPFLEVFSTI